MLLLKDLPKYECVRAISERYPTAHPGSIVAYLTLLRVASDLLSRLEAYWAGYGLSQGRFTVLMLLNREAHASRNASDLADRAGVSRATMTGLIDGLERDALVERSANPDDRRMAMIAITDQGQALLDRMLPEYFSLVRTLLAGLDDTDGATLVSLLQRLGAGIGRVDPSECGRAGAGCAHDNDSQTASTRTETSDAT